MNVAAAEFFQECDEILVRIWQYLGHLESSGVDGKVIDSLYRDIHTLKGTSQLFGYKNLGSVAHAIEAVLEPIRSRKRDLSPVLLQQVWKTVGALDSLLKDLKDSNGAQDCPQEPSFAAVCELIDAANRVFRLDYSVSKDSQTSYEKPIPTVVVVAPSADEIPLTGNSSEVISLVSENLDTQPSEPPKVQVPTEAATPKAAVEAAPPVEPPVQAVSLQKNNETRSEQPTPAGGKSNMSEPTTTGERANDRGGEISQTDASSIRVQVSLLDRLMNLVSEMVLVRNQVLQHATRSDDYEFTLLSQKLNVVTSELQDEVMKTRMQPIGNVLSKFQRLVRELSREMGKQIELIVEGADTELDKTLVEAIKDPLTHIVRNSCDHGIELPQVRQKAGKPTQGQLRIRPCPGCR